MITPLNNYTRLHSTNQVHASHNSTTHSTLWLVSEPKYRDVHVTIWYCSNAANRVCSVVLGFPWVLRLWQRSLWKLFGWFGNKTRARYFITWLYSLRQGDNGWRQQNGEFYLGDCATCLKRSLSKRSISLYLPCWLSKSAFNFHRETFSGLVIENAKDFGWVFGA